MPKAVRRGRPGRPRTPALNQQKILQSALRLADEDGVDGLSMRTLAAQLGVEAMSLYNHVANKDDILSGIADLVVGEIESTFPPEMDWKTAAQRRALSAHEVLLRHPWAAALIESRPNPSPARLRYADSILGVLRNAGFSVELAYRALLTLDSYIYGFTLQEVSWPNSPEQVPAAIARLRPVVSPVEYPHVTAVMELVARQSAAGASAIRQAEFDFGLDLVLGALERMLAASRAKRRAG